MPARRALPLTPLSPLLICTIWSRLTLSPLTDDAARPPPSVSTAAVDEPAVAARRSVDGDFVRPMADTSETAAVVVVLAAGVMSEKAEGRAVEAAEGGALVGAAYQMDERRSTID